MSILTVNKTTRRIIPGFHLSLGYTLLYVSLLVLLPLSMIFIHTMSLSWAEFVDIVTAPRATASYKVSFSTAFTAGLLNVIFGTIIAWVLVRYHFPFKRIIDGLVDLPFALPTAVAGIALTSLYAPNGWIGQFLILKLPIRHSALSLPLHLSGYHLSSVLCSLFYKILVPRLRKPLQALEQPVYKPFVKLFFQSLLLPF